MLVFAICWDVIGPAVLVVPFAVLVLDGLKILAVMYTRRCISYDLVPAWVRHSAALYVEFEHNARRRLLRDRKQLFRCATSWEWSDCVCTNGSDCSAAVDEDRASSLLG